MEDWKEAGRDIPKNDKQYKLGLCLYCGKTAPCYFKAVVRNPPKRCVYCSNIGNHGHRIVTHRNTWTVCDDYAKCDVVMNDQKISFYIDADDYDLASKFVWRISQKRRKYYVITGTYKKGTMQYLHIMLLGHVQSGYEVDHIDGDSLNNRRSNLRIVDHQTNLDNLRSTRTDNQLGIRGVCYSKRDKNYKVDFNYHGKRYYTKPWDSLTEAVWCRYCFEEYFGRPEMKNNPVAQPYLANLPANKDEIHDYVLGKILGNER